MLHIKADSARLCPTASLSAEVGQAYARVKTSEEMLFIVTGALLCSHEVAGRFLYCSRLIERGRIIKVLVS